MEMLDISRKIRAGQDMEYAPLHGTNTHVQLMVSADDSCSALHKFAAPRLIPILSNYAFPRRILDIWAREYDGERPYAFVLEHHAAGGHNAPPRNREKFAEADDISSYFDKVLGLGVPVYVAGAGSTREDYLRWTERGACGLQVGSRFALCEESGMRGDLKQEIIGRNALGEGEVHTSLRLSSTGYPFKYYPLPGSLSEEEVYAARTRICNKGYLLESHFRTNDDGSVDHTYICPGMPVKQYVNLGGEPQDTVGRDCLCNALLATAGLGDNGEPPIITLGEGGANIRRSLTAREIVEDILTPEYVASMERQLSCDPIAQTAGVG